ncbi:MAG: GH3 auxin-responsive promoter family protein, partial [Bacteroidota bacterium]
MAINLLSQLLAQGRELRDLVGFNRRKALRFQESQLKKLLYNARKTAFGQAHGFEEILLAGDVYAAFAARVPAGDYSAMYPWWQRAYNGEKDVTWPGQVKFFAMSSGTTEA